jgi:glycosyltransferase involved in cell wall biosynthesis
MVAPSTNPLTYKGLGKYCKKLFEGIARLAEVDFVQKMVEQDKVIATHSEIPLRLLYRRLFGNCDVIHALSPEMGVYSPFLYDSSVVTFHDLIPIRAAADMGFRFSSEIAYYTRITWRLAARAKAVIANSTQTRDELVRVLGVHAEKIRVIPLGVDERFKPGPKKSLERHTVGFFGNYTYRKRVDVAISAFKIMSQEARVDLVLAGGGIKTIYQRHFDMPNIVEGVENVEMLGHVTEEYLPQLYNSFDVMLFPSSYEGFGLPILEAQRCGVPVLTLRDARIPDEVKKEALVCDDAQDMAATALGLMKDRKKRQEISRRGRQYAERFTWENTVKETMSVYENL